MFDKTVLPLAAAALAATSPAAAQSAPAPSAIPSPAPFAAPAAAQAFPPGVEVLSVDGQPLGVLADVETRPGGERILHIRRPDGSLTTAPAVVASRGERAVVLEWTRAQFDDPAAAAVVPAETPAPPPSPAI